MKTKENKSTNTGNLVSDCCHAEFDPLGFERPDELWQEKCLKCGKECEPIWVENKSTNEELTQRFIHKFCNDHNGEIRFLRSIFYDEKDGAEEIMNFIKTEIQEAEEKGYQRGVKKVKQTIFNFYGGTMPTMLLDEIDNFLKSK